MGAIVADSSNRLGGRGPLLAVLLATVGLSVGCGAPASAPAPVGGSLPPRPNIIVILVDTLRADALGFGGASRTTSPRLDAWARRGVVMEQATTPSGWTRPAVVSLLTGLYPAGHGVQDKDHVLPEAAQTLGEVLRSAGYRTQAFVTNFAVHSQFGLGQGFEKFRWFDKKVDSPPGVPKKLNYVPVGAIDGEIRAFFESPPAEPFFVYIHTTDPHYPYLPPVEHLIFGTDPRARYDGEVHYTDTVIGGWLDLLEERGLLASSIVVFTADHGEEFHEHGYTGHGVTVFEECIRVPLVVWAPGLSPGRRSEQVSLTDLAPTLLEGASLPSPEGFGDQGRSFWGQVVEPEAGAGGWNWAYSELVFPSKGVSFTYREDDYRVLHIVQDKVGRKDVTLLHDLARDPFQHNDIGSTDVARREALQRKMRAVRQQQLREGAAERQPLDEEALSRLRALGYVD